MSEDEESCHALLGFRYIDDIIKKEKATQKRLQNALEEIKRSNETISTIAKSYSSIYKVDFEADTFLPFLSVISVGLLKMLYVFNTEFPFASVSFMTL